MKKLIIIDNEPIYKMLRDFIDQSKKYDLVLRHSGKLIDSSSDKFFKSIDYQINVKTNLEYIIKNFDLIISIHCQQILPKELIQSVRCINLHPGLNPFTRGWYSHVFAIIYDLPIGATLHEMDEFIDHGPIIATKIVKKELYDTSYTLYNKILNTEVELFTENFDSIINNSYQLKNVTEDGNLFYKSDYNNLLEIDLNKEGKFVDFYNRLRALSHNGYKNAYFHLPGSKKKVFISIEINVEDK